MSSLDIALVPLLKDNYAYLLHDSATGTTAVVDPAVLGVTNETQAERYHHARGLVDGFSEPFRIELTCRRIELSRRPR